MVLHYLSFCLSVKLLISPSNLNDSFAGYRVFFCFFFFRWNILGYRFFPFITLNISYHCLLACMVSAEKSADNLMGIALYIIFAFPLLFLIFFFVFHFCQFD